MTITTNAKEFVQVALTTKKARSNGATEPSKTLKTQATELAGRHASATIGRLAVVAEDDSKVVAAEKAIALAKLGGLPTRSIRKMENMLTAYKAKIQLNDPHGLTEEAKARKQASAQKGPKPGSARSNQSAVYAHKEELVPQPTTKPKTKKVLGAEDFAHPTDKQMRAEIEADLRKIASETGAPRLAQLGQKQPTQLARGINTRQAPHSAAALAAGRAKAKPPKVEKKAPTPKTQNQAAKTSKPAAPIATDDARSITVTNKEYTYGRPGSARAAAWAVCAAPTTKTVADYAQAGGKVKYLPRWVAAGAIKLG